MSEPMLFFWAGCLVSWIIAHLYYRRASNQVPKWAKEFIMHLPAIQPKPTELLRLFQQHLDLGEIEVKHEINRVACPKCGASAKNFKEKVHMVEEHGVTVVEFTCPSCGWAEWVEV